jgi:hypothetical protein
MSFYQLISSYTLDIMVITKPTTTTTATDPFATANKIYVSHISARPNSFIIPNSEPYPNPDDPSRLVYNYNLTLLPHQILILPKHLEPLLSKNIFTSQAIYSDAEIR